MWSVLVSWVIVGAIIAALIGIGFSVLSMNPPHYTIAQVCFTVTAGILLCRTGWWIAFEQPSKVIMLQQAFLGFLIFGSVGTLWIVSVIWVSNLHPPLIKQATFSTLIPFVITDMDAGIPYNSNRDDPLLSTYTKLAGIGRFPVSLQINPKTRTLTSSAVKDVDMRTFIGHVLQYYVLRSIIEMQNTITYENYQFDKGVSSITPSPVAVPDERELSTDELDTLLNSLKIEFGVNSGKNDPLL